MPKKIEIEYLSTEEIIERYLKLQEDYAELEQQYNDLDDCYSELERQSSNCSNIQEEYEEILETYNLYEFLKELRFSNSVLDDEYQKIERYVEDFIFSKSLK